MSDLIEKAAKEATGKEVMHKLKANGNILTKRKVSPHRVTKRELSLHMLSLNGA